MEPPPRIRAKVCQDPSENLPWDLEKTVILLAPRLSREPDFFSAFRLPIGRLYLTSDLTVRNEDSTANLRGSIVLQSRIFAG
jgi:hypothetical protein